MQSGKWMIISVVLGCLYGCSRIVFVSDRGGSAQIYRATVANHSLSHVVLASGASQPERFPEVSPDAARLACIRQQSGRNELVVRSLSGAGAPERILHSTPNSLGTPRWSCQQDVVAYAEHVSPTHAAIFTIRVDGQDAAPVPVTHPAENQSDSGGHDFFDNGNKIVFARSRSTGGTWDLFITRRDGTGGDTQLSATDGINELLPVISHNQEWLAYLAEVPLAPGNLERLILARVGDWAPFRQIQLQPSLGGSRIGSIAFSTADDKLYVSAVIPEVQAPAEAGKRELFEVTGILGSSPRVHRLTQNAFEDTQPEAIPVHPTPACARCADIQGQSATPSSPLLVIDGFWFQSARLPNGAVAGVSIEDYSYPRDGHNEVKVGWSEYDTGGAEVAAILFPPELFSLGPREVEVTAFHFNRCTLKAYRADGVLLSEAQHTAGQRVNQTLRLSGGPISKIQIFGSEIGIVQVCVRR